MSKPFLRLQFFLLLVNLFTIPVVSWWLYTWPEGKCPSFTTYQDCVVEYAYEREGWSLYYPCTWCPGKGTCEMMNQWTGTCSKGATYRDTCPIRADDMPRCVYFQYSFWLNYNSSPQNRNQCDQNYANDFATKNTDNSKFNITAQDSAHFFFQLVLHRQTRD